MGVSIGSGQHEFVNPFTNQPMSGAPTGSSGFYVAGREGVFLITCAHLWWLAAHEAWQKEHGILPPQELRELPLPQLAGEICIQPGHADGGTESDKIGVLEKYLVPPVGSPGIDGSSVKLDRKGLMSEALPDGTEPSGVGEPEVGERVFKVGRTTGVTEGVIREVDADVRVYNPLNGYDVVFSDVFMAEMNIQGGDSGGPVLNANRQVVGICSAGNDFIACCTRANRILSELNISPPYEIFIPRLPLIFGISALGVLAYALTRKE
jgi:hypothetical protein